VLYRTHTLRGSGLRVHTSCSATQSLRVTESHLVYANGGIRAASTLRVGDVLYADVQQQRPCIINSIEHEYNQLYWGINCVESDVLANGIKISTFGIQHSIPAAWMRYAAKVIGIDYASRLGDMFVRLIHAVGLV